MLEILYGYVFWTIQLIIFGGIIAWIINYVNNEQSYWSEHGVPSMRRIFLFGTDLELGFYDWPSATMRRVRRYGKFFGGYQLLTPVLTIMDPELIKQVFIKDFHCYMDRIQPRTYHELLNQNLLFSEAKKWKRMRSIASPSFTTGKLRAMTKTMNNCVDRLFNNLDKIIDQSNGQLETKKIVAGFTMDVIASAGFSTQMNENLGEDDLFFKSGIGLFRSTFMRMLAVLTFPKFLLNLLNIRFLFSPESFEYFCNLTREIIRQRKTMKQKPVDLLQLMLEAEVDEKVIDDNNFDNLEATDDQSDEQAPEIEKKNQSSDKKKLTESEIIANSIFFLIAGFETTSSTISHCLFQLAWHPEIQQRVYEELKENLTDLDYNSKEYYDKVMLYLPYFQAVVKETLRYYPPVTLLTRMVTADETKLNDIPLKRGTIIHIPTHAIHHCEDYYPDPERFDPERFMPENKDKLVPYTYMPFGLGPRNCIGMRFAYQEVRLALSRIIMTYRFETIPGVTQKVLSFGPRTPLLSTSPFKLKITKR
ncbi:cytochrome P450 3A41-like [Dermatophagoides pteronyssinus]|uniref:cytochrome P450 3A41-like n=1 Tax=Dermatophagoides pteronyssinus TaxID=6956 RepID=UPI003F667C70